MKQVLFYVLALSAVILTGCQKEYEMPVITAPGSTNVEISKSVDLTFNFTADGGYKSSTLVATNGNAVIKTSATAGLTSGNVVVTFTAGTTPGAGSVTLTVIDNESQTESATAVLTIYEEGAPKVTSPSNTAVIVTRSADLTFAYSAEGGYKSSVLATTGGTAVIKTDGAANSTSGNVVVTYTAARQSGAGSVTITMTDNNNKTGNGVAVLNVEAFPTTSVTASISENTTWETGEVYILEGRITVLSGVTLTIQPGVIIKGREGSGSNATALMVARGSKLIAEGRADSPIIFTSVADQIVPGEIASPNLEPTVNGLWGGLLILGKAPISAEADAMQIEGIPASDLNGLYGGTDLTDNSGIIKYVSIRHGGANIGEGNEINGLTLGGVGSGTIIENIEIVSNQDDGIEWFGGTVNVKNAIIWNTGDDAIDTDQSWGGTLDNFIVINPGDECFELDGPEGTMVAKHIIKNGSVKAGNAEGLVDLDANSNVDMDKIYFFGLKSGQDFDELPTQYTCSFTNFQATLPANTLITDFFKKGSDLFTTVVAAGARSVGANIPDFQGWSWTSASGSLTGF